jgi:hypothetical protein
MKDVLHLPCAGITLIRFDGFDLSLALNLPNCFPAGSGVRHPGETLKFCRKIKERIFSKPCNLSTAIFV